MTTKVSILPAGTWQVDPVHSSVEFLVLETHSRFTAIKGRFSDVEGTLTTAESLAEWHITGLIRPASLTTAQEQRDAHLLSPDFLNAATFPEIHFVSDRVEQVGETDLRVTGRLTMQGQPQTITLEGTVVGHGRTEEDAERAVLSAAGALSFGPLTVQITLHIAVVKQA